MIAFSFEALNFDFLTGGKARALVLAKVSARDPHVLEIGDTSYHALIGMELYLPNERQSEIRPAMLNGLQYKGGTVFQLPENMPLDGVIGKLTYGSAILCLFRLHWNQEYMEVIAGDSLVDFTSRSLTAILF